MQKELFRLLRERGVEYATYYSVEEIGQTDVLIVLGGDGTILKTAIEAGRQGVLLLGINAGNLGFLTEFEADEAKSAVDLLCNRRYVTEKRSVLEITVSGKKYYALNEATFHRHYDEAADNNVVAVTAEIDGKRVDKIVGDGIIVSTPTGSTAYSLSAGGSIMTPDCATFQLTPVCAFSMRSRPIAYSDRSELGFSLPQGALVLYGDGIYLGEAGASDRLIVRKSERSATFLTRGLSEYFRRLTQKIN